MNKQVAMVVSVLVLGGLAIGAGMMMGRNPEGAAVGTGSKGNEVWARLGEHKGTFLRTWAPEFGKTDPDPSDVLAAYSELMVQVTGTTGFWRDTVPNQWFGCKDEPNSDVCKVMTAKEADLAKWEAFREEIDSTDRSKARTFLAKNSAKMINYLDTFVPKDKSDSAMRQTAFYRDNLMTVAQK